MMTVELNLAVNREAVAERATRLGEPSWMVAKRQDALDLAPTLALPKVEKIKIEGWNFTEGTTELETVTGLSSDIEALIGENRDHMLVTRNGQLVHAQNSEASNGVIFTTLEDALKQHPELVEKYFMTEGVQVNEDRLAALNAALRNGGTFLYVPKGVKLSVPMQAIYTLEQSGAALYHHAIIVADVDSELTYIENFVSYGDEAHNVNVVTEVFVEDNAKVLFGGVDTLSKGAVTYMNRRGVVKQGAKLEWALGHMNDGHTVTETKTHLVGNDSFSDTKAVTVGRGEQKQNFNVRTDHFGKGSEGFILIHGVQKDAATSIFNGTSMIHHGASKSNGVQTERVLMLSEKARGDANPILLIDEDDVMAGHAASVGRVDELQLYYLMSRGLSRKEAERLVVHGFLQPVVSELAIDSVKERLVQVIEGKVN